MRPGQNLLLILPFDVFPPDNGGKQTGYHMIPALAKYYQVTVLQFQGLDEIYNCIGSDEAFREVKFLNANHEYAEPRDIFRFFPKKIKDAARFRYHARSLRLSASSHVLSYIGILPRLLKRNHFDFIITETNSDTLIYRTVKKYSPHTRLVFQNHNVDTDLAWADLKNNKITHSAYRQILSLESSLYKNTDHVLAVSQQDADRLNELNKNKLKVQVIQTGIPLQKYPAAKGLGQDMAGNILFCGSLDYQPNYEGLLWFYRNCWKKIVSAFPRLKLTVVGSGDPHGSLAKIFEDGSVDFKGRVKEVYPYYDAAAVVVVPLLSGSGIRLKILEAMSMGVPIVSTRKGAEGIRHTNGENILLADEADDFARLVISLLNDKNKRRALSEAGRKTIQEYYDWPVIGQRIFKILSGLN
ncbi:MAG: glycosyltransferase [Bacteroidetes bacterium]|nr:glycosyltransferase [Bacteroidota bacterium]MBS1974697.1 glycosyltransferase [Bacteroidota bacterium]